MPKILYCANCDGALINENVEGRDLYLCPMCSSIFENLENDKYRFVVKFSGGVSIKEMLNNIRDCKSN